MCQIHYFVISLTLELVTLSSATPPESKCNFRLWYLKMNAKGLFDGPLTEENLDIQDAVTEMIMNSRKNPEKNMIECSILKMYEEVLMHNSETERKQPINAEELEIDKGQPEIRTQGAGRAGSEGEQQIANEEKTVNTLDEPKIETKDKAPTESLTNAANLKSKSSEDNQKVTQMSSPTKYEREGDVKDESDPDGKDEFDDSEIDETEFGEETDEEDDLDSDSEMVTEDKNIDTQETKDKGLPKNSGEDEDADDNRLDSSKTENEGNLASKSSDTNEKMQEENAESEITQSNVKREEILNEMRVINLKEGTDKDMKYTNTAPSDTTKSNLDKHKNTRSKEEDNVNETSNEKDESTLQDDLDENKQKNVNAQAVQGKDDAEDKTGADTISSEKMATESNEKILDGERSNENEDKISQSKLRNRKEMICGICKSMYSQPIDLFCHFSTRMSVKANYDDKSPPSNNNYCSKQHVVSPSNCLLKYTRGIYVMEAQNGPENASPSPIVKEPYHTYKEAGSTVSDAKLSPNEPTGTQARREEHERKVETDNTNDVTDSNEEDLDDVGEDDGNMKGKISKQRKRRKMNNDEFEEYLRSKTLEYTHKIQSLEITITRLENTLLTDKLKDQNHSGTIARLENHILKLENELLKISKGYNEIRYQNEMLQKGQRKYLELGHTKDENQKHYQGLSNNVTKHFEVISQHQSKISQMSKLLETQSEMISDMKKHSENVENENRMLYQMIVNQTALMSQIMGRVHVLSEQNTKQREDTAKLRNELEDSIRNGKLKKDSYADEISNQLLEKLANSVSDTLLSSSNLLDKGQRRNNMHEEAQIKTIPSKSDKLFKYSSEWCSEKYRCYQNLFLQSFCPPYAVFNWHWCAKRFADFKSKTDGVGPRVKVPSEEEEQIKRYEDKEKETNDKEQKDLSSVQEQDSSVKIPKVNSKDNFQDSNQNDDGTMVHEKRHATTEGKKDMSKTEERGSEKNSLSPEKQSDSQTNDKKSEEQKEIKNKNDNSPNVVQPKTIDKPVQMQKKPVAKEPMSKRLPPKYSNPNQMDPKDCYELYKDGKRRDAVYRIKPYGLYFTIQVYCDMTNGGWTLIQKREDGTTNFFREWSEYKSGFGGIFGEHWLGNEHIHHLTNQEHYKLRIELMDWDRVTKYAEYDYFMVDDEDNGYKLHIDGYSGDAGDGMNKHNGHKFSTKDVDNDKLVKEFGGSCAIRFNAAWWFYKCYQSNLNGRFYRNGEIPDKLYDGITWKPWKGPSYSMRQVVMKILPHSASLEGT